MDKRQFRIVLNAVDHALQVLLRFGAVNLGDQVQIFHRVFVRCFLQALCEATSLKLAVAFVGPKRFRPMENACSCPPAKRRLVFRVARIAADDLDVCVNS